MRSNAGSAPLVLAARSIACKRLAVAAAGIALSVFGSAAWANQTLAADLGCYSCHGNPPRGDAPSFAALAKQYAPARNDAALQAKLADKLRYASIFRHVEAHERLSPESAARLVRWIAEGAQ